MVPFASPELALVALKSIEADPELRPDQVNEADLVSILRDFSGEACSFYRKQFFMHVSSYYCFFNRVSNAFDSELFAKDERALNMALQSFQQMIYVVQTAIDWFSSDLWKSKV